MVVRDGQMAYVLRGTCSSPLLITTDTCDPRASVMLKPSTERGPPSTTVLRGFAQAIALPRRTLGMARHPSSGRITSRRWGKQRPITQIAELYEDKSNFFCSVRRLWYLTLQTRPPVASIKLEEYPPNAKYQPHFACSSRFIRLSPRCNRRLPDHGRCSRIG